MKTGDIILTNKIEHRGFSNKDLKATFKSKPDSLMVFMLLGGVTPDSLPHFQADGAIAALGYGPIMTSRVQRGLIDALGSIKVRLDEFVTDEGTPASSMALEQIPQIDAALAAAENFRAASAPVLDPIIADAARFGALMQMLEKKVGAALVLQQLLDLPELSVQPIPGARAQLLTVIDAATKK